MQPSSICFPQTFFKVVLLVRQTLISVLELLEGKIIFFGKRIFKRTLNKNISIENKVALKILCKFLLFNTYKQVWGGKYVSKLEIEEKRSNIPRRKYLSTLFGEFEGIQQNKLLNEFS